jgi:HK97 family phage major capsid protein
MALQDVQARLNTKLDELEHLLGSGVYSEARVAPLRGEIKRLESQIEAYESLALRSGDLLRNLDRNALSTTAEQRKAIDARQHKAFEHVLRGIEIPRELRTYAPLTDSTSAGGQFLVPQAVSEDVSSKINDFGPLLKYVRSFGTSDGEVVNFPTADSTNDMGNFTDENAAIPQDGTKTNPTFGGVPIGTLIYDTGMIQASKRLAQDTAFPLVDVIMGEAAQRAARGYSDLIINGNGSTTGILNVTGTSTLTQAAPTVLAWTDIEGLEGKLVAGYAARGAYAFNFKTYRALRALNTSGVPFWHPQEYTNGLINNKPYFLCESLPDVGSGKKSVVFADWKQIVMRYVSQLEIRVQYELFANALQNGYICMQRVNSAVLQPSAIAFLAGA